MIEYWKMKLFTSTKIKTILTVSVCVDRIIFSQKIIGNIGLYIISCK